jgi:RNA polymerase primary sigma factor
MSLIPLRKASAQAPLETYLREINDTPLLTAAREKELARQIKNNGDPQAREEMVRANLRLVVNIARSYVNKGLDLPDLIEEGNLGLMRAVEGFDPDMNTRFSTYAGFWIKQSIKRALINTAKTIRIPAYMAQLLTEWRRASSLLQDKLGRLPTQEEIALHMKLPRRKLNLIKKAIRIYTANPQVDPAEDGQSIDATLVDQRFKTPDTQMIETDDVHQVLAMLDRIGEREATVLRLRFGLDGEEPKTLKEIGELLGLTRERVRQIEREALNTLRQNLETETV